MEIQAVVLALQILMLTVGWFLFQQARSELSARAAETPVLSEIKALHRSIKQLLVEIEGAAEETSAKLEKQCGEARLLLASLERALEASDEIEARSTSRKRVARKASTRDSLPSLAVTREERSEPVEAIAESPAQDNVIVLPARAAQRQAVYAMADAGDSPLAIAQATGLSEGEIETMLGLRFQRR